MDNDEVKRRFMMNATRKQSSVMSAGKFVPIICLDDDDDLKPDEDYKSFLDQLTDDVKSGYEDDTGESETRRFDVDNTGSVRSKLGNVVIIRETEHKNRVSKQRARKTAELKAQIERDNRLAERRKRKIAEIEEGASARRGNRVRRKMPEVKFENLCDVRLVSDQEYIQQDNDVGNFLEVKVEALKDACVQEDTQQDNDVRIFSEFSVEDSRDASVVGDQVDIEVETLSDVSLVNDQVDIEVETLRDVTLVSDQGYIQHDKNIRKYIEVMVGTCSVQEDFQRDSKIAETKEAVDESLRNVPVSQRNEGVSVERRKKNVGIVDKDYMSYLTWLVDSIQDSITTKQMENLQNDQSSSVPPVPDPPQESTDSLEDSTTTKQMENLQNDLSHSVPPVPDPPKESMLPEKALLVKVKEELVDLEPWYSDPDIIAVSDFPFLDGDGTTFVTSKRTINLEEGSKKDESSSCWFKKELMDVLNKPYDGRELRRLSKEVSMKRPITKYREFRKGREKSCKTNELGQSYLERYSDFDEEYKLVDLVDKPEALRLLRGFFFYLENVSHDGAFKPWEKNKQCLL